MQRGVPFDIIGPQQLHPTSPKLSPIALLILHHELNLTTDLPQQHPQHRLPPIQDSEMQNRPLQMVDRVAARPGREQRPHDDLVARHDGVHERGAALAVWGVAVEPGLVVAKEDAHDPVVALLGGDVEDADVLLVTVVVIVVVVVVVEGVCGI
jgi:hypothetical protein